MMQLLVTCNHCGADYRPRLGEPAAFEYPDGTTEPLCPPCSLEMEGEIAHYLVRLDRAMTNGSTETAVFADL